MENDLEDLPYVIRALGGDPHAFDEIVVRYQSRLYSLLLMMMKDKFGAEEVAQDAFFRAYRNLSKYDHERPFYPWLATIAARLAINWINRTGATLKRNRAGLDLESMPSNTQGPSEHLDSQQVAVDLWSQVAQLPRGERTAIILFYKQEMTVAEIAAALSVSKGTIKTFLHRGRRHLKSEIERRDNVL